MAKSTAQALENCWSGKLAVLKEWGATAYMQENLRDPNEDIPTSKAVQRGVWLAIGLHGMGVYVDRMSQDGKGGIKFEKVSPKKEWRIDRDGDCDLLQSEGPEVRRVRIGGKLP